MATFLEAPAEGPLVIPAEPPADCTVQHAPTVTVAVRRLRRSERIAVMEDTRELQIEGRLQVIEMTGAWGAYAGERIVIGTGDSYRDDLGIKIRESFEEGATEALSNGRSPSERFELPRVRITVELVEPSSAS